MSLSQSRLYGGFGDLAYSTVSMLLDRLKSDRLGLRSKKHLLPVEPEPAKG
ncbi:MAG: hypothetical protein AAFU53_00660 [Cyanobacteria bacterium J06632_3]